MRSSKQTTSTAAARKGVAKSRQTSPKRAASGRLSPAGTSRRRTTSQRGGSKYSAFGEDGQEMEAAPKLSLKERLQQLRTNGLELIDHGEVKLGLTELARAINMRLTNAAKISKNDPLWVYAEEYTLIANSEGVLRGAAAESTSDVLPFFSEAMRYIVVQGDEATPPRVGSSHTAGKRSVSKSTSAASSGRLGSNKVSPVAARSASSRGWVRAPEYFAGFAELKGVLRSLVLCNISVGQRHNEPLTKVIQLLLKALMESNGVMCTGILYNLAAAFLACGRFDDATEAIARCVELCQIYLALEPPPAPHYGMPGEIPLLNGYGAASGSGKEDTAERRRIERRWEAYNTLITTAATHAIMAHHFIATFAAWCGDMEEAEAYQCQLAAGCAQTYLARAHPVQKRCMNRLTAALARKEAAAVGKGGLVSPRRDLTPPQVPLVPQGEFLATICPLPALNASPLGGPGVTAAATGAAGGVTCSVALSQMVRICSTVPVPKELQAYLNSVSDFMRTSSSGKGQSGDGANSILPPLPLPASVQRQSMIGGMQGKRGSSAGRSSARLSLTSAALPAKSTSARTSVMMSKMDSRLTSEKRADGEATDDASEHAITPRPPARSRLGSLAGAAGADCGTPRLRTITKLSQPAYDRYKQLKMDTIRLLDTTTAITTSRPGTGGGASTTSTITASMLGDLGAGAVLISCSSTKKGSGAGALPPATIVAADGQEVTPARFMHLMDRELWRLSKIVPDDTPVREGQAARVIQRGWKCRSARVERSTRAAAVMERLNQMDAATTIWRCYRRWQDCREAVREKMVRRVLREKIRCVVLLQRYMREHLSVEEWGARCLEMYRTLVSEKLQAEKETLSATVIQAFVRRVLAQQMLRRCIAACVRVQTAWRCRLARRELLTRRVHFKLEEERRHRSLLPQIVYIQRWWRAVAARRAVAGLLGEKQRAIQVYLESEELRFESEMERYRVLPDIAGAIRTVMRVLRGAKSREELRQLHEQRLVMRRAIMYWVLRRRGKAQLQELRVEQQQRRALRRRREEVSWACIRLQSAARMWAAKAHVAELRGREEALRNAVHSIEQAYVSYRDRVLLEEERYGEALGRNTSFSTRKQRQLEEYSATQIQSIWRMYRARRAHGAYLRFMLQDRHQLAARIQRLWRLYHAKLAAQEQRRYVNEVAAMKQQQQRERLAAVRIQSLARMYLTRAQLLRDLAQPAAGRVSVMSRPLHKVLGLPPTVLRKHAAARQIQRVWRGLACRHLYQQLRLSRAFYDKEKTTQEALHYFATMIQGAVRGRLLNSLRVTQHRYKVSSLAAAREMLARKAGVVNYIDDDGKTRTSTTTKSITEAWRTEMDTQVAADAPTTPKAASVVGEEDEEVGSSKAVAVSSLVSVNTEDTALPNKEEAVVRKEPHPPKNPRMKTLYFYPSSRTQAKAKEATTTSSSPLAAHEGTRDEEAETLHSLSHTQTGVNDEVASDVIYTPEQIAAAVAIQTRWRGYLVRRTIEFYYDEYEEEVDEEEETEVS